MSELKVGDTFPEGVVFGYVPISPETSDFNSCGMPQQYNASEGKPRRPAPRSPQFTFAQAVQEIANVIVHSEFKNKKVVLVSVPGAFTPTCHVSHVPSYLNNVDKLKAHGVDHVVVIACNDPFVMSAWAKASGIKDSSFFVSAGLLRFPP